MHLGKKNERLFIKCEMCTLSTLLDEIQWVFEGFSACYVLP